MGNFLNDYIQKFEFFCSFNYFFNVQKSILICYIHNLVENFMLFRTIYSFWICNEYFGRKKFLTQPAQQKIKKSKSQKIFLGKSHGTVKVRFFLGFQGRWTRWWWKKFEIRKLCYFWIAWTLNLVSYLDPDPIRLF